MLKIAICDVENVAVSQIENIILNLCKIKGIVADIEVFYCGERLEKAILLGTRYDIIYLNTHMEKSEEIEVAKNIRLIDENVLLIYVSDYGKYMIELFQLEVFAFILKPIQDDIFTDIFLKAYRKICNRKFYFTFRYKSIDYKILCKNILYFESKGRKIIIHLQTGKVLWFNGKLSEVEAKIFNGKIPFVRTHQSFLVNFNFIESKSKTKVILLDQTQLPISEDRQSSFNKEYSDLLGEEIDVQ